MTELEAPAAKRIKVDEDAQVASPHQPVDKQDESSHDKAVVRQQHQKGQFCPLPLKWTYNEEKDKDNHRTVTLSAEVNIDMICQSCFYRVHHSRIGDHCLDWYRDHRYTAQLNAAHNHAIKAKNELRYAINKAQDDESTTSTMTTTLTELLDMLNAHNTRLLNTIDSVNDHQSYHLAFDGLHIPDYNEDDIDEDDHENACYTNYDQYKHELPTLLDCACLELSCDMLHGNRVGDFDELDDLDVSSLPNKLNMQLHFVDGDGWDVSIDVRSALAAVEAVLRTPLKDLSWLTLLGVSYSQLLAKWLHRNPTELDSLPAASLLDHRVVAARWIAPVAKLANIAEKGADATDAEIDSALAEVSDEKNVWRLVCRDVQPYLDAAEEDE